jgi:hypothetical protein
MGPNHISPLSKNYGSNASSTSLCQDYSKNPKELYIHLFEVALYMAQAIVTKIHHKSQIIWFAQFVLMCRRMNRFTQSVLICRRMDQFAQSVLTCRRMNQFTQFVLTCWRSLVVEKSWWFGADSKRSRSSQGGPNWWDLGCNTKSTVSKVDKATHPTLVGS